jgi:hypothetical protein
MRPASALSGTRCPVGMTPSTEPALSQGLDVRGDRKDLMRRARHRLFPRSQIRTYADDGVKRLTDKTHRVLVLAHEDARRLNRPRWGWPNGE